jgi:predicted dehydrogenase
VDVDLAKILIAFITLLGAITALQQTTLTGASAQDRQGEVRFITLDPGHFHAALVQKEMYPGVSRQVYVYAPLGQELVDHLGRVARYNNRPDNPTNWELVVKTGPDFLQRVLQERPGNVVVISGRNRCKIDYVNASLNGGLNVLVDKPWILNAAELPKLETALRTAEQRGLIAYDIMTERYEVTTMLQKELINDESIFGKIISGTADEPGVSFEGVHHLMKIVSGVPNLRPAWFFDIEQQGEGMNDVGTHLVDLVPFMLFPGQPIDYHRDIEMQAAKRWPTMLSKADFRKVTGVDQFPEYLSTNVHGDQLSLFVNSEAQYRLRGINITLKSSWNYEAPPGGGDTQTSVFKGTNSRVEVRQGQEQKLVPEVYVVPNDSAQKVTILSALQKKVAALQGQYAGLAIEDLGAELHLRIPAAYRDGHEAHFAAVTRQFLAYLANPRALPAWEKANMMAKYYVTTRAVELSRQANGSQTSQTRRSLKP